MSNALSFMRNNLFKLHLFHWEVLRPFPQANPFSSLVPPLDPPADTQDGVTTEKRGKKDKKEKSAKQE